MTIKADTDSTKTKKPGIEVTLYLSGDCLDPNIVSSAMGIAPSASWKKGDAIWRNGSVRARRKRGQWIVVQNNLEDGRPLQEMIEELLQTLPPPDNSYQNISGVDEASLGVLVTIPPEAKDFECAIGNLTLSNLTDFGCSIQMAVIPHWP